MMTTRYRGKIVNDIMLVDEEGKVEYSNVKIPEFFDLKPEEMIGQTVPELYENLDNETSTLEVAVIQGKETLGITQELHTRGGKRVKQTSDTLLIKDGDKIAGAMEITYYYDEKKDVLRENDPGIYCNLDDLRGYTVDDIVGESPKMLLIKTKIAKIADLSAPILITGETGTGKELLAHVIHNVGRCKAKPFVYLNCNAIPESLLEGILFGVEKGSYTDAVESRGMFRMADRGTLFIDEIDTMPLSVQGKLLKAIEDKRVRPIGGDREYTFNVRIIASCNHSVSDIINGKDMRQDFYYRLAVIQLELPPLCQRNDDALLIAKYYLGLYNKAGNSSKSFTKDAEKYFIGNKWPGNIREVKNAVEMLYYQSDEESIGYEDIVEIMRNSAFGEQKSALADTAARDYSEFVKSGCTLKEFMDKEEKRMVMTALDNNNGAVIKAAEELKVSPQLLRQKIHKHEL